MTKTAKQITTGIVSAGAVGLGMTLFARFPSPDNAALFIAYIFGVGYLAGSIMAMIGVTTRRDEA